MNSFPLNLVATANAPAAETKRFSDGSQNPPPKSFEATMRDAEEASDTLESLVVESETESSELSIVASAVFQSAAFAQVLTSSQEFEVSVDDLAASEDSIKLTTGSADGIAAGLNAAPLPTAVEAEFDPKRAFEELAAEGEAPDRMITDNQTQSQTDLTAELPDQFQSAAQDDQPKPQTLIAPEQVDVQAVDDFSSSIESSESERRVTSPAAESRNPSSNAEFANPGNSPQIESMNRSDVDSIALSPQSQRNIETVSGEGHERNSQSQLQKNQVFVDSQTSVGDVEAVPNPNPSPGTLDPFVARESNAKNANDADALASRNQPSQSLTPNDQASPAVQPTVGDAEVVVSQNQQDQNLPSVDQELVAIGNDSGDVEVLTNQNELNKSQPAQSRGFESDVENVDADSDKLATQAPVNQSQSAENQTPDTIQNVGVNVAAAVNQNVPAQDQVARNVQSLSDDVEGLTNPDLPTQEQEVGDFPNEDMVSEEVTSQNGPVSDLSGDQPRDGQPTLSSIQPDISNFAQFDSIDALPQRTDLAEPSAALQGGLISANSLPVAQDTTAQVSSLSNNSTSTQFATATASTQVAQALQTSFTSFNDEPTQTISLELHPPELGQLKITVEQSTDHMTAQIIATELNSTELLLKEKDFLLEALSDLGFGETSLDISHGGSNQNQGDLDQQNNLPKQYKAATTAAETKPIVKQNTTGVNFVA